MTTLSSPTPITTTTETETETKNFSVAEAIREVEFNLPSDHYNKTDWIDISLRSIKLFADTYGIHPTDDPQQITSKYFTMTSSCHLELRKATTELHQMFIQATEYVLQNSQYWPYFGFPDQYWAMARKSFQTSPQSLCGRFDFAISAEYGIKCYEYNADSASCLIECAHTQEAWSNAMGLGGIGVDGGLGAAKRVISAWSKLFPKSPQQQQEEQQQTLIHFFYDHTDREECVHVAYCSLLAEQAGLRCKEISSIDGFAFNSDGLIVDREGDLVKHIWKSWNYTTLLEIFEREGPLRRCGEVRLIDICLNENISILEPIWSAIPANKAILPVLTQLFPDSPYLLYSSFALDEKLMKNGYCSKPVLGRGGQNISLHFPSSDISQIDVNDPNYFTAQSSPSVDTPPPAAAAPSASDTDAPPPPPSALVVAPGKFSESPTVYQELATLPRFSGLYTQLNTFTAYGTYAGTVIRVEPSAIVGYNSNVYVLRVIEDGTNTALPTDEIEF